MKLADFELYKSSNEIMFDYKRTSLFYFQYSGKYVFSHVIGDSDCGGVMDIENGRLKIVGVDMI